MSVFLDTSGLLCLCNRSQPLQQQSSAALQSAAQRATHSYVPAEFVALALARRMALPDILQFEREV